MKRYDLVTPEGTKDYLFTECLARREVEKTFRDIFIKGGYSEVITPGIEFYDLFSKEGRKIPQEQLYKLSDGKGRLIVIRPDSTLPIARLVATRLKEFKLPLRLFYNQTVYSVNPLLAGRSDEFAQAGIELIGSSSKKADLEVIRTAISTLSQFNLDEDSFTIEIGHIGVFKHLINKLNISAELWEEIRALVEGKNFPALNDLLDSIGDNVIIKTLKNLPRLFGGQEVFEKLTELYSDEVLDKIVSDLKEVCDTLAHYGYKDKISVDLGIVNRTDYYSGLVFHGYLKGFGEPVISGGRYDNLIKGFGRDVPATGFAVNVNAVATVLRKSGYKFASTQEKVLVFSENSYEMEAFSYADKNTTDEVLYEVSLFDTIEESVDYAKTLGIKKIIIIKENVEEILVEGGSENE